MASRQRGWGEDSIYYDQGRGRYIGAVSLGYSPDGKRLRRKVSGRTKAEVRTALRALHKELDSGVSSDKGYTVRRCLSDFMESLNGSKAPKTLKSYRYCLDRISAEIGGIRLTDLKAQDVERALVKASARMSDDTLRLTLGLVKRAIQRAEKRDLVGRNVAALADVPRGGRDGRPSKAFGLDQSVRLLEASKGTRLEAYVTVSLLTGIRTEEARALRWDNVDLDAGTLAVWRSVRVGADTKTEKSRRTLALPQRAVEALKEHRKRQSEDRLKAGELWEDNGLVFCREDGRSLTEESVRKSFKLITAKAGLGTDWAPRELRHTFVSIMSSNDVAIEDISRLAGHSGTAITERVYRHELRPALTKGAEIMDAIFGPT